MAACGRSKLVDGKTCRALLTAYSTRLDHQEWLYTMEECASLVGIDVKSARLVLRDLTGILVERYLSENNPHEVCPGTLTNTRRKSYRGT